MDKNNFAQRLIALIEDLRISERAFSDKIGKSMSYINTLKKENSSPSLSVVTSILDAYPQVNLYWLTLGVGTMYLSDEDRKTYFGDKKTSVNQDYNSLFEEYRNENAQLRQELHDTHDAILEMMKKNGALQEENTALRLAAISNRQ